MDCRLAAPISLKRIGMVMKMCFIGQSVFFLSQPEKALATLDSVERVGLLKPYDINFLRCLTYHNGYSDYHKALRYGLAAYNMPDAPREAETRLWLIDLIADEYLNNVDTEFRI